MKTKEKTDIYNGEYVARTVSTFLNNMGSRRSETGEPLFIKTMAQDHRSIQQKFTNLTFSWIKHLSEQQHWDLRNEASVLLAKEVFRRIDPDKISAVKCII